MLKPKPKPQNLPKLVGLTLAVLAMLGSIFGALNQNQRSAYAATNSTVNFQARLMTNAGAIVADNDYNVEFKLFNASAIDGGETPLQGSCTTNPGAVADEDCLWTETRTAGNKVTVRNGYLTVNLGSVTSFPSTINWDQDLWLTMRVGGTGTPSWDTEMSPRLKMTAVPYAFRAGALAYQSGANTAVLQFAASIGQSTVVTLPDPGAGTATVCYQSATACGFVAGTATNYIQNGTSTQTSSNFHIDGTGTAAMLEAYDIRNPGDVSMLNIGGTTTTTLNLGHANTTTINLKQNTVLAAGKNLTFTAGAGNFDQSASTGTFSTGTGTVTLAGNTSIANNKSFTANGDALFKDATDSTTAFQIQNSATTPVFTIDTTANASNLVTNPSLETDVSGWNARTGCTRTRVTTQAAFGAASLSCVNTATVGAGVNYPLTLTASTPYTVSFYVKASASFSTLDFGYAFDGSNETTLLSAGNAPSSAYWMRFTYSFNSGAVSGTPYFFIKQSDGGTARTFYIDGLQVETGASASAFRDNRLSFNGAVNTAFLVQPTVDTNTAFAVYNTAGSQIFNVNTNTSRVGIGSLNPNARLQVQGVSVGLPVTILRAASGQTADLLQFQDNNSNVNAAFSALGNQLTLGRIASSGTATAGLLVLGDGTTDNFGATLTINPAALLTANRTIYLPDAAGTICLQSAAACGFAPGTNASYIRNDTAQQTSANFNIVSAGAGSITALIQGATSGTVPVTVIRGGATPGAGADLLSLQDSAGTTIFAKFDNAGSLTLGNNADKTISVATAVSGNNGNGLTIQAGAGLGTNKNGGSLTLQGGAGTGSGTSGAITIQTANAASGIAGNITIDTGTTSTGTPTINLGTANASVVNIANSGTNAATVSIANNGTPHTINIGNGAASNTIVIGSTTGGSSKIQAGAASLTVTAGVTTISGEISVNGIQPATVAGNGTNGVYSNINAATGGNTSGTTGQFGGNGAAIYLAGGNGGTAPAGSTNGSGGSVFIDGGNFGAGAGNGAFRGNVILQQSGGLIGIGTISPSSSYKVDIVGGDVNIASGSAYRINGASLNTAGTLTNVAYLNQSQTFTGTNTFQPTTNITSLIARQTSVVSPTADIFAVKTVSGNNVIQVTGPSADNAAVNITSVGANAVTLTAGAASTWSTSAGLLTLQGAGGVTINTPASTSASTQAITIQSGSATVGSNLNAGAVTIDTGTRTGIGTAILNLGTTNAVTLNIGNNTSNPSITIDSGTSSILVGTGAQARTITIGSTGAAGAVAQTVNIGTNSTAGATNTVVIGNSTATASTVNINGGTGTSAVVLQAGASGTIQIGANAATKTISIGSVGTTAGNSTIDIGTSSNNNQAITIGSTSNANDITILQGGSAAAGGIRLNSTTIGLTATNPFITTSGSNTLRIDTAGAAALTIGDTNANAINIANSSTNAATINIANNATAHSINMGTGAASNTIIIGSTTGGTTKLQGGSGTLTVSASTTTIVGEIVSTGIQPASSAGNGTNISAVISITGAKGGNTSGTTGQTAGNGGNAYLTGGDGGDAVAGSNNGWGGGVFISGGAIGTGGAGGFRGNVILQAAGGAVGIGTLSPNPSYKLDAAGDINISSGSAYRINAVSICTSSGCTASSASAILNQTAVLQTANFRIQGVATGTNTGTIQALGSQTADLLQFQTSAGGPIAGVRPSGTIWSAPVTDPNTDVPSDTRLFIQSLNNSSKAIIARASAGGAPTGDILQLQSATGSSTYFAVSATGATTIKPGTDTGSALVVQASGGNNVLQADTQDMQVSVGNTATANAQLNMTGDISWLGPLLEPVQSFESVTFVPTSPGTWSTGGNVSWSRTTALSRLGAASARSGAIANSQTSWLDQNYTFASAGTLAFDWTVSSEDGFDYLFVCVDNDSCTASTGYTYRISGEVGWTEVTLPVTSGAHSFRWIYTKDANTIGGSDRGAIDNLRFTATNTTAGSGVIRGADLQLAATNTIIFGTGSGQPKQQIMIDTDGFTISDDLESATQKSYRMRTSGLALDLEAAGANFHISTWSGSNYTGTQYNQIVFSNAGVDILMSRGIDVTGKIQLNSTGTGTTNGLCHSGANSTGTFTDRDIVACSAAPSDIAEWYPSQDGVEPADLVATTDETFDYTEKKMDALTGMQTDITTNHTISVLGKSSGAYDKHMLGVVSTSPYQTYGRSVIEGGANNPQPIALAGRVPVKVSAENGPIAVGDFITSSSIPGVGMKATGAGMVVGTAISAFDGTGVGQVTIVINPHWYYPFEGNNVQNGSNASLAALTVSGHTTLNSLAVTGSGQFGGLNVSGHTTVQSLTVIDNANIGGDLTVQGTIETKNIIVSGKIITAGEAPTLSPENNLGNAPSVEVSGNDTSGTVTFTAGHNPIPHTGETNIVAGGKLVKISFHAAFAGNPRVILTPANNNAADIKYYYQATANEFWIMTNAAPTEGETYAFSYLVVQ